MKVEHFACGHRKTLDNIYEEKNHAPRCLACKRERVREYYVKNGDPRQQRNKRFGKTLLELAWK